MGACFSKPKLSGLKGNYTKRQKKTFAFSKTGKRDPT
jgi:hypothetical protein